MRRYQSAFASICFCTKYLSVNFLCIQLSTLRIRKIYDICILLNCLLKVFSPSADFSLTTTLASSLKFLYDYVFSSQGEKWWYIVHYLISRNRWRRSLGSYILVYSKHFRFRLLLFSYWNYMNGTPLCAERHSVVALHLFEFSST